MRTALVLLLLLALAAIPGSVIPQEGVDSLKTSNWQDDHPKLTPVYERLGLFSVYDSPWFSAIYILLMISLVGCIVPRTFVYWRGDARQAAGGAAQPDPAAGPRVVHDRRGARGRARAGATALLKRRRYRLVGRPTATARSRPSAATCARPATWSSTCPCWWCWSASRWAACSATRAA